VGSAGERKKEETLEEGNDNELRREEYSFDELAMGLADGTLTRSRLLKYIGAAILGSLTVVC
jgi:hypothetical protein